MKVFKDQRANFLSVDLQARQDGNIGESEFEDAFKDPSREIFHDGDDGKHVLILEGEIKVFQMREANLRLRKDLVDDARMETCGKRGEFGTSEINGH